MTHPAAFAGALTLHPGRPAPNIESTRAAWARPLARGRRASDLPDVLAAVFRLCGDAHRLAARRAVAAARGTMAEPGPDDAVALQVDTLREHLRRAWLDWPAALGGTAAAEADLLALRDCPLLRRGAAPREALAAMPAWVEAHVLGHAADDWLASWEGDPAGWLDAWSRRSDTLPARALRHARNVAIARVAAPLPRVPAEAPALAALADAMRADPAFVLAPQRQGRCAETGPWTRLADPAPERWRTAWLRLGTRLAETVRLALPDVDGERGGRWLQQGAMRVGEREGLAWCEMARGLLVHRVALDGTDADAVGECDVLAPTEWNFHPHGAVAAALAALPADADERAVRVLAAAFDPCVAVRIGREAKEAGRA